MAFYVYYHFLESIGSCVRITLFVCLFIVINQYLFVQINICLSNKMTLIELERHSMIYLGVLRS